MWCSVRSADLQTQLFAAVSVSVIDGSLHQLTTIEKCMSWCPIDGHCFVYAPSKWHHNIVSNAAATEYSGVSSADGQWRPTGEPNNHKRDSD